MTDFNIILSEASLLTMFSSLQVKVLSNVLSNTLSIILGYPQRPHLIAQSTLLRFFVESLGEESLLLADMYYIFRNFVGVVLKARSCQNVNARVFSCFMEDIHCHPIFDKTSDHHSVLQAIGKVYRQYVDHKADRNSGAAGQLEASPPVVQCIVTPIESPLASGMTLVKMQEALWFITNTIPLVHMPTHHRSIDQAHATETEGVSCKIIWQMSTNLDRYLPFREKAPSVRCIRQAGGPFDPENLRTLPGFFSALLFCAVTFSTPFLFSHAPLLQSLDAWDESMSRIKDMVAEPSTDRWYFCDPNVYGTATRCSVDIVPSLWSAAEGKWMLLSDNNKIGFHKFYHWLAKDMSDNSGNGQKTFLQFGPLIAYLLTVDYSYTAVVSSPSLDDMANAIAHINAGGIKGLEALGILPDTRNMKLDVQIAAVKPAFEMFYDFLDKALTAEQKGIIGFDYIMVEHTLCKIARLKVL